jgi:hypothetical protein
VGGHVRDEPVTVVLDVVDLRLDHIELLRPLLLDAQEVLAPLGRIRVLGMQPRLVRLGDVVALQVVGLVQRPHDDPLGLGQVAETQVHVGGRDGLGLIAGIQVVPARPRRAVGVKLTQRQRRYAAMRLFAMAPVETFVVTRATVLLGSRLALAFAARAVAAE